MKKWHFDGHGVNIDGERVMKCALDRDADRQRFELLSALVAALPELIFAVQQLTVAHPLNCACRRCELARQFCEFDLLPRKD